MTADLSVGLAVIAARAADPPTPWKDLCRQYGLQRTRLYELARDAERSFGSSPLPLAVCGPSLADTAANLAAAAGANIDRTPAP